MNWIEQNWKGEIGYNPEFHILPRGWILMKLRYEEDGKKLLGRSWSWGPSGLILQKWRIDFDATREPFNIQQVWVIMPSLPMTFWEEECLEAIGNRIGKFVALEPNWETKVDHRCTRILVELDLKDGLYEEILINMHGSQWK